MFVAVNTLSLAQLAVAYNAYAPHPVKRFATRELGVRRVTEVMTEKGRFRAKDGTFTAEPPLAQALGLDVPVADLDAVGGSVNPGAVSPGMARMKKRVGAEGAEEIRQKVVAEQDAVKTDVAKRPPTEPKAPPADYPPPAEAKAGKWADSAVITVKAEKNPRTGAAAERFALLKSGMTVGDFVKVSPSRGRAIRDLRKMVKRGHVTLS